MRRRSVPHRKRQQERSGFPWGPWFFWSLWVILLSGLTTFGVLLFWEWRNPCPCSPGVVGPPALPSIAATPTQAMFPYIALEGETLDDVAQKFGVPVPTLQALNNLPEGQPLQPGQLIFVPGTPPVSEAGAPQVRIVEVLGVGLLEQERVRIMNMSPQPVSLEGWSVLDEDGLIFRFPFVRLYAQGSLFLWSKRGLNTAVDVYWGLDNAVWERGETVILRNPQGQEVQRFRIP